MFRYIPVVITLIFFTISAIAKNSHKTTFFNLRPQNCSVKLSNNVSRQLRRRLRRTPNLTLLPSRNVNKILNKNKEKTYCFNEDCGARFGKLTKSDRVLIGSVSCIKKKYSKRLGDTGKGQYLIKSRDDEYYIITVKIIDVHEKKVIAKIKETTKKRGINRAVYRVSKKMRNYFQPKADAIKKNKVTAVDNSNIIYTLSLSPSLIAPRGSFKNVGEAGYGFTVNPGIKNLFVNNSALRFSASYYFLTGKNKLIESYQMADLSFHAGYGFPVSGNFEVTPLLGFGYLLHLVKDKGDGEQYKIYYDPVLSIKCEINYNFLNNYSVSLMPGYGIFFEKSSTGRFISLSVGMSMVF